MANFEHEILVIGQDAATSRKIGAEAEMAGNPWATLIKSNYLTAAADVLKGRRPGIAFVAGEPEGNGAADLLTWHLAMFRC